MSGFVGSRDDLNPYSRRFADRLFATYPAWEAQSVREPWPNADAGSFLVTLLSPAHPERELWVGTDGGEITVGFGKEWHDHHGGWTGASEEESFGEALEQIQGILDERLILAVGFRAGSAAASTLIARGTEPKLGSGIERIEYYSWRGTYDSVIPA